MDLLLSSVEGNRQSLDGGAMFGNAPQALWKRWFAPDALNRIELACRGLLVEYGSCKYLLETGIGNFLRPDLAKRYGVKDYSTHVLLRSLAELGVDEEQIDFVILSHLHFDHAGGLLPSYSASSDAKGGCPANLHFPKATYLVSAKAWERSRNPHPRDRASFIPGLCDALESTGRLHIVEPGVAVPRLPSEFSFVYSHGHTPGQMHTLLKGKDASVFFCGDLIPGEAWLPVPITMGYDRYPEKLSEEKQAVYAAADTDKLWLYFTHDPQSVAIRFVRDPEGKIKPTCKESNWQRKPLRA